MGRYVVRRLLQAVPLLIAVSAITFGLLQMAPGGPLAIGENPSGERATAEQLDRLRQRYGLDDPLPVQYLRWAGDLVRGDWGVSFNAGRPVLDLIVERLPATLLLTGSALVLTLLLAIPIGIISAVRQYSLFDYLATGLAFVGLATPGFWLALMLLFAFSFSLGWLPSSGLNDLRESYTGWAAIGDRMVHLVLPVTVLALTSAAGLSRYIRAAMLDVLSQDYLRTARAKGLRERTVIARHALKNAALPIVTLLALEIPELFLGAVVVESIFALPGMGRLFIQSAEVRDYPVLMGILLIAAVLVVLANLLADVLYSRLDPRISYREGGSA